MRLGEKLIKIISLLLRNKWSYQWHFNKRRNIFDTKYTDYTINRIYAFFTVYSNTVNDSHFKHERFVNGGVVFDVALLLIELNWVKEKKYLSWGLYGPKALITNASHLMKRIYLHSLNIKQKGKYCDYPFISEK